MSYNFAKSVAHSGLDSSEYAIHASMRCSITVSGSSWSYGVPPASFARSNAICVCSPIDITLFVNRPLNAWPRLFVNVKSKVHDSWCRGSSPDAATGVAAPSTCALSSAIDGESCAGMRKSAGLITQSTWQFVQVQSSIFQAAVQRLDILLECQ